MIYAHVLYDPASSMYVPARKAPCSPFVITVRVFRSVL